VCFFFRTILFEGIDAGEYGLLPSAYPDQGQVICVYPPMCSFDKMSLAHRARDFMLCRYRHMNGDSIWVKQDEKAVRCGYKYRFVIPRYSAKLGQYYVSYQGLLDYYHHNPQRFIDELVMMDTVVRKLRQSPVPERELMDIFQFFGDISGHPPMSVYGIIVVLSSDIFWKLCGIEAGCFQLW